MHYRVVNVRDTLFKVYREDLIGEHIAGRVWGVGDMLGHEADFDIFLKGGSGLGVLRASHGLRQRHKMVVLSNYATPDIRRKCLELGADRVFDKSNEIDALIQYCGRLAAGQDGHSGPGALA